MFSRWRKSFGGAFALRIGLWYAVVFAVSAAALALASYGLLARALAAQDHDVLDAMLTRYAREYERAGLPGLRSLIETDAGEGRHERLMVRVIGRGTEVVYFAEPPGWNAFDLASLNAGPARAGWITITHPADASVLEVGSTALPDGVVVQVGRSSRVRDELLAGYRAGALEVMALIVVIAMLGGVLLTDVALRPLRALDGTVRGIVRTGRFDARVVTRGTSDPLDELGGLVNEMLGRIQTLITGMRGALDNVAHDLRTPLTRFRSVAESALLADDPAALRDGLGRALEEADRVSTTLTALMDISEAETGTMALTPSTIELASVVGEAVDLYADEAEDKEIVLASRVAPGVTLTADRTRLRQVLANLIENAVKYTGPGGRVTIESHADDHEVTVTVRDTGIGIAASDLPFVWDRLYRADVSRSARGVGLGLSLVKAIVEAHGGRVRVESQPGQGSTFSVVLPAHWRGGAARS
jgi:signal transduction histidine kinase